MERGKRQEQAVCGAPGWNRTSDTRFRKHAEGVLDGGASWAIVLHGAGFWDGAVIARAALCWAVRGSLVGGMSAGEYDAPLHLNVSAGDRREDGIPLVEHGSQVFRQHGRQGADLSHHRLPSRAPRHRPKALT